MVLELPWRFKELLKSSAWAWKLYFSWWLTVLCFLSSWSTGWMAWICGAGFQKQVNRHNVSKCIQPAWPFGVLLSQLWGQEWGGEKPWFVAFVYFCCVNISTALPYSYYQSFLTTPAHSCDLNIGAHHLRLPCQKDPLSELHFILVAPWQETQSTCWRLGDELQRGCNDHWLMPKRSGESLHFTCSHGLGSSAANNRQQTWSPVPWAGFSSSLILEELQAGQSSSLDMQGGKLFSSFFGILALNETKYVLRFNWMQQTSAFCQGY